MIAMKLICFYLFFVVGILADRKLPSYVHICKRFDPKISECWKDSVLDLKPYLVKGIPELDIPPFEPFFLEGAHLDRSNSQNLNILADFYNLTIYGFPDFDIPFAKIDNKDYTLEVDILFHKIRIEGGYKGKGKLLTFDIEGEGTTEIEFVELKSHCVWRLKMHQKNGKDYLKIEESDIHSEVQSTKVFFHDLFKGNPEITANVNQAINDNMDILFDDVRPLIDEVVMSLFNKFGQRVLDLYPADVLYPLE